MAFTNAEQTWSLKLVFPKYSYRLLCCFWILVILFLCFLLCSSLVFVSSFEFVLLGLALLILTAAVARWHLLSFKALFSTANRLTEIRFHNHQWYLQWGEHQTLQPIVILHETRTWPYWVLLHCRAKNLEQGAGPELLWLPKDAFIKQQKNGCLNDDDFRHLSRLLSFYSLQHGSPAQNSSLT